MSIWSLARNSFTLRRRTARLTDSAGSTQSVPLGVLPGSISDPAHAAHLQFQIGGSDVTGTISLTGQTPDGVAEEVLTFTEAGYKRTRRLFSTVATLTFSGFAVPGSWYGAKWVGSGGGNVLRNPEQPDMINIRGAVTYGSPKWAGNLKETQQATILIPYVPAWSFTEGDFLVDDSTGEQWKVEGYKALRGPLQMHHWEVHASLSQGEF